MILMMPYFDKEKLKRKIISEYGMNLTYNDVRQVLKELPDEDVAPLYMHIGKKRNTKDNQLVMCLSVQIVVKSLI